MQRHATASGLGNEANGVSRLGIEAPPLRQTTMEPSISLAPGVRLLHRLAGKPLTFKQHRILVFIVTFVAYTTYHASRRPTSIVKSELHHPDNEASACHAPLPKAANGTVPYEAKSTDWKPFDGHEGQVRLGDLDLGYLGAYAVGLILTGYLGDRCNLRKMLLVGMLGSGITTVVFALGYFFQIHSFSFYLFAQILAGGWQSTGWPVVVAIIAHWFGRGKRGLVLGIWNAHTSVGNSLGALLGASVLDYGWAWPFVLLGVFMCVMAILVWTFLVVDPSDVNLLGPDKVNSDLTEFMDLEEAEGDGIVYAAQYAQESPRTHKPQNTGFFRALFIPGVIPFALALFFSKMVAYTFLYWLPFYNSSLCIHGKSVSTKTASELTILFDLGGIVGGIIAGYLSDVTQSSATVSTVFTFIAVPVLCLFNQIGHYSVLVNALLLIIGGLFVNGPYALITTAVAADLGSHNSLDGNKQALATVTAIIDGMGSLGAALGPALTGEILSASGKHSFDIVFIMLGGSSLLGGVFLSGLVKKEVMSWLGKKNQQAQGEQETSRLVNSSRPL